jgi:hypothetical protein
LHRILLQNSIIERHPEIKILVELLKKLHLTFTKSSFAIVKRQKAAPPSNIWV